MNENPTCRATIRADLKAFADGELSPLVRLRVARHLRSCPSCQEELTHMQTLSTELQESESEPAPLAPELRAHILESAPTEEPDAEEVFQRRQQRIYRKKMVLAVGMCSIAAVLFASTLLGSKVKNTFNMAADSMGTTKSDTAPSAPQGAATGMDDGPSRRMAENESARNIFTDGHVKSLGQNALGASLRPMFKATDRAESNAQASINSTASASAANPATNDSSFLPPERAVHREGSMAVDVDKTENASDNATMIIKNAGGFVANTALETGANQKRTATLDCRVPVAQFETVVRKIGALGKVRAKSLSGQDITAQVAQSGARRQTLTQELSIAQARLDESEKSRKKTDTFELRAEVRTIRIQAAQARAQLEALQKYGSLSSLYVSLQDATPSATPKVAGWFDSLSPSSQSAWNTFLATARLPLQLLLWVLAYSPLWLPLLLVWRKFGRKWLLD